MTHYTIDDTTNTLMTESKSKSESIRVLNYFGGPFCVWCGVCMTTMQHDNPAGTALALSNYKSRPLPQMSGLLPPRTRSATARPDLADPSASSSSPTSTSLLLSYSPLPLLPHTALHLSSSSELDPHTPILSEIEIRDDLC